MRGGEPVKLPGARKGHRHALASPSPRFVPAVPAVPKESSSTIPEEKFLNFSRRQNGAEGTGRVATHQGGRGGVVRHLDAGIDGCGDGD